MIDPTRVVRLERGDPLLDEFLSLLQTGIPTIMVNELTVLIHPLNHIMVRLGLLLPASLVTAGAGRALAQITIWYINLPSYMEQYRN